MIADKSKLCSAWAISHYDKESESYIVEEEIFIQRKGKNFTSGRRKFSKEMEPEGTVWTPVNKIPNGAEYIGLYHVKNL